MGLASNILNALGGSPAILSPSFIPSYPSALPVHGNTTDPFTVHLGKLDPQSIVTFLHIELPRDLAHDDDDDPTAADGTFVDEDGTASNTVMDETVAAIKMIGKSLVPPQEKPKPVEVTSAEVKAEAKRQKRQQKLEAWKAKQQAALEQREFCLKVAGNSNVSELLKGRAEMKIDSLLESDDFAKPPSPLVESDSD